VGTDDGRLVRMASGELSEVHGAIFAGRSSGAA
jgi:hypothetical protein